MKTYVYKSFYTNAYISIIYNKKKVETTQMSINWRMEKQNVAIFIVHNEMSFGQKKNEVPV